jgi:hypothetical protein
MSPTRATRVHELHELLQDLGDDELRTLVWLARRLRDGQRQYGRIDLAHDVRDFRRERSEEVGDLLVYSAFAELAAMAKRAT